MAPREGRLLSAGAAPRNRRGAGASRPGVRGAAPIRGIFRSRRLRDCKSSGAESEVCIAAASGISGGLDLAAKTLEN